MNQFNIKEINQIYQREVRMVKSQFEATTKEAQVALGVRGAEADDIADNFCEAWPNFVKFVNWASLFGAWFPGMAPMITMAKGVVTALDKAIVPMVCAAANAQPPSPEVQQERRPPKEPADRR